MKTRISRARTLSATVPAVSSPITGSDLMKWKQDRNIKTTWPWFSTAAAYPINHWNSYPVNHWNLYPVNHWNLYPVNHWNSYPVNHWNSYPVNHWNSYQVSHWNSDLVNHWNYFGAVMKDATDSWASWKLHQHQHTNKSVLAKVLTLRVRSVLMFLKSLCPRKPGGGQQSAVTT